jgi:hypothetical protein
MTDITIPPEALEAAAIELAPAPWSMYTEDAQEHFRRKARAACLAMLRAWPGAIHNGHWLLFPHTKLPLPMETTND